MTFPKAPSIFLLGPGYLGLQIIDLLLIASYPVTTLVRTKEAALSLSYQGVKTVFGTLDDLDLITTQAAAHDITINTSSSDHVSSAEAFLSGLRQRVEKGLPTALIHTSGTGLLADNAKGKYKSDVIYSDDDPSKIDALPPTAIHRNVDLTIVQAAKEFGEKAKLAIIIPPVIYGFNPEHKRVSMALPGLVRFALKHGFSGRVNEGRNVWGVVHVADLARAYLILLSHLSVSAATSSQSPLTSSNLIENPYFFADSGDEFHWAEMAHHVGRVLHKLGKIESPDTKAFEREQYGDVFGPYTELAAGGNSRTRSVRLRELGWLPREKGIWRSWEEDEVDFIIESEEAVNKRN